MGRLKRELRLIENTASRHVTFSKRRNGLFKKAFELSVMCEAQVALIIFTKNGGLFEYSSSSMEEILERYERHVDADINRRTEQSDQTHETESQVRKMEDLESSKRKLFGEGLQSCSITELQELEEQLEKSLISIRKRKMELISELIKQLKDKEKKLAAENQKYLMKLQECHEKSRENIIRPCQGSGVNLEVQTELFIGPPGRR